jgi:transcriptional regulator with XRE-family HTH domain
LAPAERIAQAQWRWWWRLALMVAVGSRIAQSSRRYRRYAKIQAFLPRNAAISPRELTAALVPPGSRMPVMMAAQLPSSPALNGEDLVNAVRHVPTEQDLQLGRRIHELRRARQLTLARLAELTGLSHPFLSQVERGLARPSMRSLQRIARALGSSQVELFVPAEDEVFDAPAAVRTRAGEGARGAYGLGQGRLLVPGKRKFRPLEVYGENTEPGEYFVHAEAEFLYVLDGALFVDLQGSPVEELRVGDSLYIDGAVAHRWAAPAGGAYRLLVVKEG